jgi:hypothetical protein
MQKRENVRLPFYRDDDDGCNVCVVESYIVLLGCVFRLSTNIKQIALLHRNNSKSLNQFSQFYSEHYQHKKERHTNNVNYVGFTGA